MPGASKYIFKLTPTRRSGRVGGVITATGTREPGEEVMDRSG